ncbi:MAG: DUF4384 domain-containing protein [Burkholderiaceae bacterium]
MRCKSISYQIACLSRFCIPILVGMLTPLATHAAPATLAIDAELRTDHYIDAAAISRLAKGTRVETLESEAGWIKVQSGSSVGWLRASQLITIAKPSSSATKDGRSGAENVMAISGIRSMPRASIDANDVISDINERRDTNRTVSVRLRNPALNIGKDGLDFSVTSSHDGYLYLIVLGSDNKSFYMLFPNDLDHDNAIKAGKALKLPRKAWEVTAQGPSGTDKMLVVVTESPRNLIELGKNKAGPFVTMPTDTEGRHNLQWLLGTSTNPASSACRHDNQQSSHTAAQKCADPFGSTLIEIVEK